MKRRKLSEYEPWPINADLRVAQKPGRLARFLESLAIVLLTALAAYAAST
jgi:hypothetical protein